ncbi:tape measure protein [Parabacteroides pacaensis]|uniref:tape measure protein n=1 Tax=Parabacteroides pacaensis TaxID=2086575 RepID=UPI00131BA7B1|nr:tape measure protein [Parabacteroides pacaensis]
MAGLHFDITGDNSNFMRKLEETRNGVINTSKRIEESGMSIEQMFSRMTKAAAAFGAGFSAQQFVSQVMKVRGEFQQLEVAFNTMLGSKEKADTLMSQLVRTAAITPFDLQGVANGAKQLLAYGTAAEDVNSTLVRLGDIAAGLSIPLGDLVYLYGTTMTQGRLFTQDLRQFQGRGIPLADELAKQFGVAKDKVGELVTAGKVGFPEVQKAIEAMTNDGGKFGGLMEAQSKTITGQISNIEDAIATMYNNIGKQSEGFINDALSGVSYLVENYETIGKTILELAAVYGTYKAVLMSVAAYQSFATVVTYSAEIAELSKLIPLKQQSANEDVIADVASGKLTQSKAEQIIALRAEIAAKIQSLQATEAQTKAEYASAMAIYKSTTQRMLVAKQNMDIAQSQMSIAIKSGTVDEIAAAKKNAQTASLELNNAAIAKNTAHKSLNIASTNKKTATDALSTMQTGVNTAVQNANTTSTNILTVAKTRLASASRALGLSMLANPYVLVAAAVAGLGYGIYKLITYQTDAEKAQLKLNDSIKECEKKSLSEQRELAKLKGELSALTKGTDEYNTVKDKIVKNFGKYYSGLDAEIEKVGLTETAYNKLTEAINKSFGARQYEKFATEQQEELSNTMAENLGKIQDKLYEKLGDEQGAKIYAKIRNGIIQGAISLGENGLYDIKGIDSETKNALDKSAGKDSGLFDVTNRAIEGYIRNIITANKMTDELDKKAKERFGIDDNTGKKVDNTNTNKEAEKKEASEWLSLYKKAYEDAEKAYNDFLKSKQVMSDSDRDKELKRLKGIRDEAKTTYESKGGSVSSNTKQENQSEKEAEKKKKEQQKLSEELLSLRLQNQQAEINLMADGSGKKIAQINLDYDKEIAAILAKEKEWKYSQGGKLTEEQTVEIRTSLVQSYVKKEKSIGLVSSIQLAEEKRMMNEYMKEYGTYLEKRQAITELYNEKIKKATTEGERLSLGEEMKKELAAVDDEAQKKTSIITKLFSDMSNRTVTDIRLIADEAQKMLDYINEGEFKTDSDGNGLFSLTKEQFDILSKSPEKLQAVKDEIANVNREADRFETSFNKVSNGLKKVFASKNDVKKLKEGLAEIEEGMNEIMQAGQFLSTTFSKLGDSFGGVFSGIADGLNVAMDAVSSAMDGAKAGAMFGPIGSAAGAAIGVVTSLAGAIAKIHDKKNEKRIERLQYQIDTLDKLYEKLDKSIQKAYSNDASSLINQQNKLLEQQKVLIQQQIREEEDKKKTDKDRIKEWQDQIEKINKTIEENKEKQIDAIFGEDVKSAIDSFAQAYVNALAAGDDKVKASKDLVKNMIKQMIVESMKMDIANPMKRIREKLLDFWSDNRITDWEQSYIDSMIEDLTQQLDQQYAWADKYLKGEEKSPERTATAKGAIQASQESVDQVTGIATAVQEYTYKIYMAVDEMRVHNMKMAESLLYLVNLKDISEELNSAIKFREVISGHLSKIEEYTSYCKKLENMEKSLEGISENVERAVNHGVYLK